MKKHLAVTLSILALLISLASIGLVYLLDQKTNTDINDARVKLYENQVKYYEDTIKSMEDTRKEEWKLFCKAGLKEACEKE